MIVQQFTVLLNDSLKRHILGLPPKEKRRLREKFEFLEAGIWDSGLRVKKLKSFSNRVLFEIRSIIKGAKPPFRLDRFRRLVDTFRKNSFAHFGRGSYGFSRIRRIEPSVFICVPL